MIRDQNQTKVVTSMSVAEAQHCVQAIRRCLDMAATQVERAERLAYDLYEREGWRQLGYASWLACMEMEIPGKSRSRYYQLLKAGTTLAQLTAPLDSNQLESDGSEVVYALSERHLLSLSQLSDGQREQALSEAIQRFGHNFSARELELVVDEIRNPLLCVTCGKRSQLEHRHCSTCGELLRYAEVIHCPICGHHFREVVVHCQRCGDHYEPEYYDACPSCDTPAHEIDDPGQETERGRDSSLARPAPIDLIDDAAPPGLLTPIPTGSAAWVANALSGPDEVEPVSQSPLRLITSSKSVEWYTPVAYVSAVRELLGTLELDPASCAVANETVQATCFYTEADDGLRQPWHGRLFVNPPYGIREGQSQQGLWSARLIEEYQRGQVTEAVLLVNAVPAERWFQPLWQFLLCFTDHRIHFCTAEGEASSPTHGNVFVYLGSQRDRFVRLFTPFGTVVERVSLAHPS